MLSWGRRGSCFLAKARALVGEQRISSWVLADAILMFFCFLLWFFLCIITLKLCWMTGRHQSGRWPVWSPAFIFRGRAARGVVRASCFMLLEKVSNFKLPFSAPSCHFFLLLALFLQGVASHRGQRRGPASGQGAMAAQTPLELSVWVSWKPALSSKVLQFTDNDAVIPLPSSCRAVPQTVFLLLVGDEALSGYTEM